jgi:hypothetical protein
VPHAGPGTANGGTRYMALAIRPPLPTAGKSRV